MTAFKDIEQDQVAINQEVGARKSALESLIDHQKQADTIKEGIAKRKAEEPVVITGEEDEIRERRAHIAVMAAHLEGVGAAIGEVFPSPFVKAQEEQAQAGRDTLEAQQHIQDKQTQVNAAQHMRETRKTNPVPRKKKATSNLVNKGKSVVSEVDA